MQEIEIEKAFDNKLLDFTGFSYENENNSAKARVEIYFTNKLKYSRRSDLEGTNSIISIIDIVGECPMWITGITTVSHSCIKQVSCYSMNFEQT